MLLSLKPIRDPCVMDLRIKSNARIEMRTCRIFRGEKFIADKEKWNGKLTVIETLTDTEKKSNGQKASEQRLYI